MSGAGRLVVGAIAGIVGTAAMTAAMRRLHGHLPPDQRYPMPPREVIDAAKADAPLLSTAETTIATHFAFGATVGALFNLIGVRPNAAAYGLGALGVWAGSYFGLFPALKLLTPATQHPARRNLLMIAAHMVWGLAAALTARELAAASRTIFGPGQAKDAAPHHGPPRGSAR